MNILFGVLQEEKDFDILNHLLLRDEFNIYECKSNIVKFTKPTSEATSFPESLLFRPTRRFVDSGN